MDKLMLFNKIETCEVEKISSTTNSLDEMIVPSYWHDSFYYRACTKKCYENSVLQ